ncbi:MULTISPECIES: S8/S53 family peptidase [unclassified Pseudomonas]|uniref:S8/S53 family peptidase n=1 Tax=unclassified Pseudomonas TaxID=196821 RepID=UPI00244D26CA|nr:MULTISPECIES: S8/S53 family peptidase [unclassified Pseudomonas]MDH0301021.1 S8/S53 family peptidase [Pseudomonas sp. GD04091]MDH1983447.1 S8/S53 family peptidase [Pseudomonas sp. GD03689]
MRNLTVWPLVLAACLGLDDSRAWATAIRIESLAPCETWSADAPMEWCLQVKGMPEPTPTVVINGADVTSERVTRFGRVLRLRPDDLARSSGPMWLRANGGTSNAVWLSRQRAQVVASHLGRRVRIADRVLTTVDLVSLVFLEDAQGLVEAKRIASAHGLEIVGAIAPLNVYQFRLGTRRLEQRNSLLRLLEEDAAVAGVLVEDDNQGALPDRDRVIEPADLQGWVANNFQPAIDLYRGHTRSLRTHRILVGVIEKAVDFDVPELSGYARSCERPATCVYALDQPAENAHGSIVSGVLVAAAGQHGSLGFLSRLEGAGDGFAIIVDRGAPSGVIARVAASVNLVEDGVRVLNWSWGIHRLGATNLYGEPVAANVRSDQAFEGYGKLLERYFAWLKLNHPDVVVVSSAGNGSSTTGDHLPTSLLSDQLLVVGGHQRSGLDVAIGDGRFVVPRHSSNRGRRVDITAAACLRPATIEWMGVDQGTGCGTSYATALVTGTVAAMLSINPDLTPGQVRAMLRQSAWPLAGKRGDVDLTAALAVDERAGNTAPGIGQYARLNMQRALALAIKSRATPSVAVEGPAAPPNPEDGLGAR